MVTNKIVLLEILLVVQNFNIALKKAMAIALMAQTAAIALMAQTAFFKATLKFYLSKFFSNEQFFVLFL